MTSCLAALPDLATEHLFQNGGSQCQILHFFGDRFLGIECTLEAETSVSNLTQYKLFIGDDKNNMPFGVTSFNFVELHSNLDSS